MDKLGCQDRVQGGLFSDMIDREPAEESLETPSGVFVLQDVRVQARASQGRAGWGLISDTIVGGSADFNADESPRQEVRFLIEFLIGWRAWPAGLNDCAPGLQV